MIRYRDVVLRPTSALIGPPLDARGLVAAATMLMVSSIAAALLCNQIGESLDRQRRARHA